MKKIRKFKKVILIIVIIPILFLLINRMFALYYDKDYIEIGQEIRSGKYEMKKINIIGNLKSISSGEFIVPKYDPSGALELIDNSSFYNSKVFLDTIHMNFIVSVDEYISGSERDDNFISSDNYITIDKEGKVINRVVIDSTNYVLKNCVFLKDKMDAIRDLDNSSQFIFMKHFLKTGYRPCFIPSMSLGISNVNYYCKTWSGIAYFDLTAKGEKFRFKFSNEIAGFFFADKFDFNFDYYEIPNKYSQNLDLCFFINNDSIYIIKKG